MTTLKDIGRALGLSTTQVSRALNGHSDVSEETRQRVIETAKRLNYQPNIFARRLVTGRSGIVGLVLPFFPDPATEYLHMRIVAGMSAHFAHAGMLFVLHIADTEEDIVDVYRRLTAGGSLEGFILLEPRIDDPRIAFLEDCGTAFVVHGRADVTAEYPFFDIDNNEVGHVLARHLIERGHRRIAFVNGPPGRAFAEERLRGYHRALAEAGIGFDPRLIRRVEMTEGNGLIGAMELFSSQQGRPTAVICGNTLIARGVYSALAALGLTIPGDVSVVAHDDILPDVHAAAFYPALSCTVAPLEESWRPLAEFLVSALQSKPLATLQKVGRFKFIARESAGLAVSAHIPVKVV